MRKGDKNFGNILFLFFGVCVFERKFFEFSFVSREAYCVVLMVFCVFD